MTFYVLLSFFILWSRGTLGAPVRPNETSLYFPGVPCLPSACNYSVAGVAGILVSSSPSNVVRQPTDETFLMTIGGMDPDGFLQSSVRLTNISDLIKGLDPHWFTPKFCGATVLTPLDELLEGFASPSWCAQTSKNLIYFMDLKSSPILLYSLNLVTWSWTRLDGGKLEPTPRQLYATTCYNDSILVHGGITRSQDDEKIASSMWRFNLTTLSWTNLLDIPKSSSLWNHKMAALRGHLIIQGGLTLVNGTPSANKELWDLDLDKMSWRNVRKTIVNSTSNKPEEFLGGGTLTNWNESLIVVFGGPTETTAVNASRWTISFLGFNATRGNWFWKLENSSSVIPRSGHGSVWDPQSNSLISFGGVPTQRDGDAYNALRELPYFDVYPL